MFFKVKQRSDPVRFLFMEHPREKRKRDKVQKKVQVIE